MFTTVYNNSTLECLIYAVTDTKSFCAVHLLCQQCFEISVTQLQCVLLNRCTGVNGVLFACADVSQSVLRILPLTESSASFSTVPLPVSLVTAAFIIACSYMLEVWK